MWYHDQKGAWLTPMGPSDPNAAKRNSDAVAIPKELTEGALAKRAQEILQQSGPDKTVVNIALDRKSSDKVVYHNGVQGGVKLALQRMPEVPGLTVKLDQAELGAGQNGTIQIEYVPPAGGAGAAIQNTSITLQLLVEPFNRLVPIRVNLAAAGAAK